MRLQGKVAIVTGGLQGIGKATVELFLQEGASVVVADLPKSGGEWNPAADSEPSKYVYIQTDVTQEESVKRLVAQTVDRFGRLDILFANAGIGESAMIHTMTYADWQRVIDVNLNSVFLSNKYGIEAMLAGGGGSIINNASFLGFVGQQGVIANAAAKGGVINLTRTLGVNYAKQGIRVNSICAGYTLTPVITAKPQEVIDEFVSKHPIGRLAEPIEIAKAVLFLASDDSSFVVGSNLMVDGGYTAQ
ncbi:MULTISPECIES: SDR family NAD(P)-dependent oxidoreductase [Paenibacillus]|uniref:SDR family NAD(P)-dependent oxidoreductase n=1 Tax=Paenibacillus TaxID=44249 RepID=UPI0006CF4BA9|nr:MULTISPECIES: SDR family oxidoreductase [Paenibacillus]GCL73325.1 3-oxoacyl-ACP reductase [Paenibacillus naphthalenovorans]SDI32447.1 NAD(P)-dependent dehydrogenase, short-chain alcohol dehydrogenase family [Paenibacillus naphthalenovorans]